MNYEILNGQTVINTIVADLAFMQVAYPAGNYREAPAPAAPEIRHITRLAFLSRFTDAEAVAIDLASIGATAQAASMRRYLNKVNAATFIDLDRPDTRAGVQALESGGILSAGRALEILDAPVQPGERAA